MNTFGQKLRLTTFGESHGPAIGGIIDGFPSGFKIDFDKIQQEMAKRAPGSSPFVTQRKETDEPEFLSGISEDGITLGSPIGFIIRNRDTRSKDYSESAHKYRPNHADFTYTAKYGVRDYKGGGRASARETANWVLAGALALQWLENKGIGISTALTGVGECSYTEEIINKFCLHPDDNRIIEVPLEIEEKFKEIILKAKNNGDSVGGCVSAVVTGLKEGIGNPIFDKLQARLALAMMSINAAKAFEYGSGTLSSRKYGSDTADLMYSQDGQILTSTNFSGGIQGGITNGMPIFFNVHFKPTPTIMKEMPTVDENLVETVIKMKGRHDPCVALRAVPVVRAMAALVVTDFIL